MSFSNPSLFVRTSINRVVAGICNFVSNDTAKLDCDLPSGEFDFDFIADGSVDSAVHDLGSGNVSDTIWIMRINQVNFSTLNNISEGFFAITNTDETTNMDDSPQDGISMVYLQSATDSQRKLFCTVADEQNFNTNITGSGTITLTTGTDFFYQLKRITATSCTATIYDDSAFTSVVATVNEVPASTTDGMQFIKFFNRDSFATANMTGTLQRVRFWDGTNDTSGAPDFDDVFDGT